MVKVTMYEIEQCRNSHDMKIEIDDVFDEIVGKRVETKNEKQVQYVETVESDDVFDEVFERQVDVPYHNLHLENKSTLTVKCLYKEEEDDVFDEEQEKKEQALTKHSVYAGIKIEVDQDSDASYEEKNLEDFGSLIDVIKEENDTPSSIKDIQYETSVMQNVINTVFMEVDEQKIKLEDDVESEARTNESNGAKYNFIATQKTILEKHLSSHRVESSNESGESNCTQTEVVKNHINVNNNFKRIQHPHIESEKKESVLRTPLEKFKQVREKQMERNNVKLGKQNEHIVNANTFVNKTRNEKKLGNEIETCNFKKDNGNQTVRDSKEQKENAITICSKNSQDKDKGTGTSGNIDYICGKEESVVSKGLSQRSIFNDKSSKIKNSDTIKKCIQDRNKSGTEKDGRKLVNEQHQSVSVPNDPLNVEKQKHESSSTHDEQEEMLHKEMENVETMSVSKENVEVIVTETAHNENDTETHSKIENQKDCKSKQNKTDIFLSNNDSNLSTVKEVVLDDIQLENIEYCCTKCEFKTKDRTIFKPHLRKHGTEFFSGISFLDLVNSEAVAARQFESGQNKMKEHKAEPHKIVHNEALSEKKKKNWKMK